MERTTYRTMLNIRNTLLAVACSLTACVHAQDAVQLAFLNATAPAGIKSLHALTQRMEPNTARSTAYQGASTAMLAEVDGSVWAKWRHCRDGMRLLDQAVASAPNDAEIRFLRFVVADATPGFLGFKSHVQADAEVVTKALEAFDPLMDNPFWERARTVLIASTSLNTEQLTRIRKQPSGPTPR